MTSHFLFFALFLALATARPTRELHSEHAPFLIDLKYRSPEYMPLEVTAIGSTRASVDSTRDDVNVHWKDDTRIIINFKINKQIEFDSMDVEVCIFDNDYMPKVVKIDILPQMEKYCQNEDGRYICKRGHAAIDIRLPTPSEFEITPQRNDVVMFGFNGRNGKEMTPLAEASVMLFHSATRIAMPRPLEELFAL